MGAGDGAAAAADAVEVPVTADGDADKSATTTTATKTKRTKGKKDKTKKKKKKKKKTTKDKDKKASGAAANDASAAAPASGGGGGVTANSSTSSLTLNTSAAHAMKRKSATDKRARRLSVAAATNALHRQGSREMIVALDIAGLQGSSLTSSLDDVSFGGGGGGGSSTSESPTLSTRSSGPKMSARSTSGYLADKSDISRAADALLSPRTDRSHRDAVAMLYDLHSHAFNDKKDDQCWHLMRKMRPLQLQVLKSRADIAGRGADVFTACGTAGCTAVESGAKPSMQYLDDEGMLLNFNRMKEHEDGVWVCLTCGATGCLEHALAHYADADAAEHNVCAHSRSLAVWCLRCRGEVRTDDATLKVVMENCRRLISGGEMVTSVPAVAAAGRTAAGRQPAQPQHQRRLGMFLEHAARLAARAVNAASAPVKNIAGAPGRRGLVNLGNSCFLNSVLQVLVHLDAFCDELRGGVASGDGDGGSTSGAAPVAAGLLEVYDAMYAAENARILPRVHSAICKARPDFLGFGHHDAHELLMSVLQLLAAEEEAASGGGLGDSSTVVASFFEGQVAFQRRCGNCGHCDGDTQPFLSLSLPVSSEEVHGVMHTRRQSAAAKRTDAAVAAAASKSGEVAPEKTTMTTMKKKKKKAKKTKAEKQSADSTDASQQPTEAKAKKKKKKAKKKKKKKADDATTTPTTTTTTSPPVSPGRVQVISGVVRVKSYSLGAAKLPRPNVIEESLRLSPRKLPSRRSSGGGGAALDTCLRNFFGEQTTPSALDGGIACGACDGNGATMTVWSEIVALPRVLVLHIERSVLDADGGVVKIEDKVKFKKTLNMAAFTATAAAAGGTTTTYTLNAVVEHTGTSGGGHFATALRDGAGKKKSEWTYFDDNFLTRASSRDVMALQGYMLVYTRNDKKQ